MHQLRAAYQFVSVIKTLTANKVSTLNVKDIYEMCFFYAAFHHWPEICILHELDQRMLAMIDEASDSC